LSAATAAAATMSGVIRLSMFVTMIVLASLVVEQDAFEFSFKGMLTGKSYSAAQRSHAMKLMGQRAINKIRANIQGSKTQKAASTCDTSDITDCLPTGPSVEFSPSMTFEELEWFCGNAINFAMCISDIDLDDCKQSPYYSSYFGIANAAMMYYAMCNPDTINVVFENLACMIKVLADDTCAKKFDNKPTDNAAICRDYVDYLTCYYDETIKACDRDETAAGIVQQMVNYEIANLLKQDNIDCTSPAKRPTKTEDMFARLLGSKTKTDKRSQLLDLLDELAATNKKSA